MLARPSNYLILLLFGAITAYVVLQLRDRPIIIGVYDPAGHFDDTSTVNAESIFIDWNANIDDFKQKLQNLSAKNRVPVVTIEPWPNSKDTPYSDYLKNMSKGDYDAQIETICNATKQTTQELYIRWGHEMELKNSRYYWSNKDPSHFIESYNYFVQKCRSINDKAKFIWSPAGDVGLDKYWPDPKNVDFIGISVYSYKEWDIQNYQHQRSFKEIFREKYNRVKIYKKPIWIAELGVTGTSSYKETWLSEAKKTIANTRYMYGLIYFNSIDVEGVWGKNYETPVWNVDSVVFSSVFED